MTTDAATVSPQRGARRRGLDLFLVGFLVLFWELACIRWFAANVIFLQFFTNVVLLASFLGMSCGCLAARARADWLGRLPWVALGTVLAALATLLVYQSWSGLAVDVGHQASPQQVFFGTEYRNPDVARFVIPIEAIAAVFFVLVALIFVGLGQVLGRAFDAYPDRVLGYTLNIGGSLAGILGFSLLAFAQTPPLVWFLIGAAGVAFLLARGGGLTVARGAALAALLAVVAVPIATLMSGVQTRWSPYYEIQYDPAGRSITVNTIGHQTMVPFEQGGSSYSLIHLLQREAGGPPFQDVLIIGAGSGNDMDHALHYGAGRIDAVEIDPVIQDIGIRENPDRAYQDPRVVRHLDDGRHFLRTTDRKYDLVIYALVDSLVLHSSYADVRLESFLFTQQAFDDIKRVLKPGGMFVSYNYLRQGWIVERVGAMMRQSFGSDPIILNLPYRETLEPADPVGFAMLIGGDNQRLAQAFRDRGPFWLNTLPPRNVDAHGFGVRPSDLPEAERGQWERVGPTTLLTGAEPPPVASDDWPFVYLRGRLIPDLSVRSMVVLGVLGILMVWYFMPRRRLQLHGRMFFLGAAFMLLETKAVVQMALLFGSTWLVNSAVFFTVLVLILLANLYVLRAREVALGRHYAGLFALLLVNVLVPLDLFLGGNPVLRYVVPCVLALGPMFFAGVIFARTFRDAPDADVAFGSNIAGSVLGGLSESFSMLLGFRYLLLLAILFYALSAWTPSLRAGRAPLPGAAT